MEAQISEIQKLVFNGKVPLRFVFPSIAAPLCFDANRTISLGYFTYNFLGYFIEKEENLKDMWFCAEGQPIKWQLPLGVIYDVLRPNVETFSPLTIEVRFDNFPEGKVLRCDSFQTAIQFFNHTFKESCFLAYGNCNLVQANTDIHKNIAESVVENDYSKFKNLFELHTKEISSWKMWPIKFLDKEFNVTNSLLTAEDGQTLKSALEFKGINAEKVTIHGVNIPLESPLKDLMSIMVYPDGFLYASTN
ncbi:hypothetical protein GPJ56_010128 [Histomonas meleagridis]|uniref:uncharacterized protein n=1 Tax=Histomonas meleagridis TaxID=135588 RepID=UPI0035594DFE|nr:hypothetical protein GPJ56_010128 [Histomonas meleagridis]KAH0806785.1 hypothetical protein GO595_000428 [Histomonas meleagridis]